MDSVAHPSSNPDRWIQRRDSKGRWKTDATFIGGGAQERAEAALAHKMEVAPQHTFRIAPPRQPMTYEQLADLRFREKPAASTESKWVMGD